MQQDLLTISVEYCATWNYTPRAVRLADEILSNRKIEYFVKDWTMIPASGGKFEVVVNGELLFSKKALGRHAEPMEVHDLVWDFLLALLPKGFEFPEDDD